MQRYFVSRNDFNSQQITISDEDFFHIKQVMRMKIHDKVTCVDQDGTTYLCEVSQLDKPYVTILEVLDEDHELDITTRLIYSLPKLDKFELVLQKCTELGINEVVPFISKRSLIKVDKDKFSKKKERYEKIAKEACEQSKRQRKVIIHDCMTLKQLSQFDADFKLVAYEESSRQGECMAFEKALRQIKKGQTINFVVGPEGGFDQSEIDELVDMGYVACSLGKRILRSETAPIFMMSVISYSRELKE